MPAITGIVETALYVSDLARSGGFYERVFGLERLMADDRMRAYAVAENHVLLLFRRGGSVQPTQTPGGTIPPHDAAGHQHFAFSIPASDADDWETHLSEQGVAIESRMTCGGSGGGPGGGTSLYFRDPDGHVGELITPGCWRVY